MFSQRESAVGEEIELEDAGADLFAEAQVRAREQAAYEQLKASGMYLHCAVQYRMIIFINISFLFGDVCAQDVPTDGFFKNLS